MRTLHYAGGRVYYLFYLFYPFYTLLYKPTSHTCKWVMSTTSWTCIHQYQKQHLPPQKMLDKLFAQTYIHVFCSVMFWYVLLIVQYVLVFTHCFELKSVKGVVVHSIHHIYQWTISTNVTIHAQSIHMWRNFQCKYLVINIVKHNKTLVKHWQKISNNIV